MKKVLVLVLVLAMTQLTWAGIATLQVNSADAASDYAPGTTVTIEIVYDFTAGGMSMDSVDATAGSWSDPALNIGFDDVHVNGTVAGSSITGIGGSTGTSSADVAAGAVLWSAEFTVPELPSSSIVTISTSNFFVSPTDFSDMTFETNALELHVIPEPITLALLGLGGLFIRRPARSTPSDEPER
jgi:hypothetical protein